MRIKELRLQNGMSQAQLGSLIGKTQKCIATWETNTREPNLDSLIQLSDIFGVTLDYLVGRNFNEEDSTREELLKVFCGLSESGQQDVVQYAKFIAAKETAKL